MDILIAKTRIFSCSSIGRLFIVAMIFEMR